MNLSEIYYVSDAQGNHIAVIIPIKMWEELIKETGTTDLLKREKTKKDVLPTKNS
jgi:hypothetical protein